MTHRPDDSYRWIQIANGVQPDRDLTAEERLLADVIRLNTRIPVGYQIGLPMHLRSAIEDVGRLFTEHELPHRVPLLDQLRRWHDHARGGLAYAERCDRIMDDVVRHTSAIADEAVASLPPLGMDRR